MMDLERKDLKEISKGDKVVYRYMEDIEKLNKSPEFREYMSVEEDLRKIHNSEMSEAKRVGREEGIKEGIKEGILEGERQGEKNKSIEIAKNMLKEDIDINKIIKCTQLTKEEIERLN